MHPDARDRCAVLCFVAGLTQPMGQVRKTLIFPSLLLFPVCLVGVWIFGQATSLAVADRWIVLSALGAFLLFCCLYPAGRANVLKGKGKFVRWLMVIVNSLTGLGFMTLFGWNFAGDFLLDRQHVRGMAESKEIRSGTLSIHTYYLRLNGRDYETTAEVYDRANVPAYSIAEIGVASNTVFRLDPMPFPEVAPPVQFLPPPSQQK